MEHICEEEKTWVLTDEDGEDDEVGRPWTPDVSPANEQDQTDERHHTNTYRQTDTDTDRQTNHKSNSDVLCTR